MKSIALSTCLALVLAFASVATADPVGGEINGTARVSAYTTNIHKVLYRGGEQADFSIRGDGDTDLNLIVRDANGNEVIRTRGAGDRAHVVWTPTQTGYYFISVVNSGDVYNEYSYRAY